MHGIAEKPALSLQPSQLLIAFAQRQVSRARFYPDHERRNESRHLIAMPVTVVPIDRRLNPIAPAMAMMTRDISSQGVGLIYEQELEHALIALQLALPGEDANLIAEVRWTQPMGPFYHIGCKVIDKLAHFPMFDLQRTQFRVN